MTVIRSHEFGLRYVILSLSSSVKSIATFVPLEAREDKASAMTDRSNSCDPVAHPTFASSSRRG